MDNVRTNCGVDRSTFHLAGHVDRSHAIVLKMTLIKISILFSGFSCYQYMYVVSPCVLCELELLFTICTLKHKLIFILPL